MSPRCQHPRRHALCMVLVMLFLGAVLWTGLTFSQHDAPCSTADGCLPTRNETAIGGEKRRAPLAPEPCMIQKEEGGVFTEAPCHWEGALPASKVEEILGRLKPAPAVTWLGKIMVGTDDSRKSRSTPYTYMRYELGLREDGVVVWRKKE